MLVFWLASLLRRLLRSLPEFNLARPARRSREPGRKRRASEIEGGESAHARHRPTKATSLESDGGAKPLAAGINFSDQRPGSRLPAQSPNSFAFFAKVLKQPITIWTRPGTPSRNPSLST